MVMEPKYYAEDVIGQPNHDLRIWPLIPRALGRDIVAITGLKDHHR